MNNKMEKSENENVFPDATVLHNFQNYLQIPSFASFGKYFNIFQVIKRTYRIQF